MSPVAGWEPVRSRFIRHHRRNDSGAGVRGGDFNPRNQRCTGILTVPLSAALILRVFNPDRHAASIFFIAAAIAASECGPDCSLMKITSQKRTMETARLSHTSLTRN